MEHAVPESVFYARHFRLPGFSADTQQRLKSARVLVLGLGGLGCPIALYLAGAGVGTLALCDGDVVSATNLHRQVLFDVASIGQKKVDVAATRLRSINPHIAIETLPSFATREFLETTVGNYDVVIDGTDNFVAKFAINDACALAGVPLVYGSIFQFEGQVSVFHLATADAPRGYCYRDLYPEAPPAGLSQNCGEAGVIGVLPGIIGTLQANEAIKIITGLGTPLAGQLLTFDALTGSSSSFALELRDPATAQHGESAYEIGYSDLLTRLQGSSAPCLVDVRDINERELVSIGGLHIPLPELHANLDLLPPKGEIVLYCKSGVRSARAALYLRSVLPGAVVFNLRGGVDASSAAGFVCAAA